MTNWNVRREQPSVEELKENLHEAKVDEVKARRHHGEGSVEHRGALEVIKLTERKVAAAEAAEEKRAADAKLTPSEVVDRVMNW